MSSLVVFAFADRLSQRTAFTFLFSFYRSRREVIKRTGYEEIIDRDRHVHVHVKTKSNMKLSNF